MISLLLAAALLQADPAVSPGATATAPAAAAPAAAAPAESDTPNGAPVGDYDFVAWCHGALTGHMALYNLVKPELGSIERPDEVAEDAKTDKLQMEAGRAYLALYTRALAGVDHGHGPLIARRHAAEAQGARIWNAAKAADARTRMWSWLLWDLPGRCEIAAKRLETPEGRLAALHSPAPTSSLVASGAAAEPGGIDAALSATPPAAASPEPAAPTPAETPAPPQPSSPDAPVSTNPAGAATPPPSAPGARGPQ